MGSNGKISPWQINPVERSVMIQSDPCTTNPEHKHAKEDTSQAFTILAHFVSLGPWSLVPGSVQDFFGPWSQVNTKIYFALVFACCSKWDSKFCWSLVLGPKMLPRCPWILGPWSKLRSTLYLALGFPAYSCLREVLH